MKEFSASVPMEELVAEFEKDPRWKEAYAKVDLEMSLAIQIALARDRAHMTQAQLAKAIGTTQSVISRIEQADQNLTLETLRRISNALNCSLSIQFGKAAT